MANLRLGVLKDVVNHGKEWGLEQSYIDGRTAELQKSITDYSDYVYTTFNKGLEQIKKNTKGENDQTIWNQANGYVTKMTVSALDFVPLWSLMDPYAYDKPVHLQQTRQVFGDIKNWTMNNDWSYDAILDGARGDGYRGQLAVLTKQGYNDNGPRTTYIGETYWDGSGNDYGTNSLSWGSWTDLSKKAKTDTEFKAPNVDNKPITNHSEPVFMMSKYRLNHNPDAGLKEAFGDDIDAKSIPSGNKLMQLTPLQ
ncbi:insecticidal delta-endotoxin Cry8Ea1 family protein [Bacillus cereus]